MGLGGVLRRFLGQPRPLNLEPGPDLGRSFLTGLFVFLFLLVFQPFGLSGNESGLRYVLISGYGLVSFLAIAFGLILVPQGLKKVFDEERWTVAKEILWDLGIVLAVGLANFLFACLVNSARPFFRLGFNAFLYFLYFLFMTLVVALFPIVFWTLWSQSRRLKDNLRAAGEISAKIQSRESLPAGFPVMGRKVVLVAENGRDRYPFEAGEILFIAAERNYVEVAATGEKIRTVLIRNSLSKIEGQLRGFPSFVRCHRAFIVNLEKIRKAVGNAQGLRLALEGTERKVPVARRYARTFQERLARS